MHTKKIFFKLLNYKRWNFSCTILCQLAVHHKVNILSLYVYMLIKNAKK